MSSYCYVSLPKELGNIRLLRLIPDQDDTAIIQCELFQYSLSLQSSRSTHLYEALSYVWGDPGKTLPIIIHGKAFNVTANLHAALLQLRNHSIERILWVDAICIDQDNQAEKEHQIGYMADIYGQANRVLVWLGEAADDSNLAFEEMRHFRGKGDMTVMEMQRLESASLALLQRPWFQRIWILQEVAAARNIVIMCGQKKIDGYVFCTGMESFNISYKTRQELQRLIRLVTYLIREAIYRPEYSTEITSGGMGLEICPLSGLLDMYHAQKATKRHDKVYALLSMSSDGDLRDAGLSPNYAISWEELFQRLIKHLLPGRMSVQTCESREVAIIKSKGRILGKVVEIQRDPVRGDRLLVEVALQKTLIQMGQTENWSNHWSIQMSAKRIQKGDFICVFEGALKPAICRLNGDYFTIIVLEVLFSDDSPRRSRSFEQKASLLSETHSSGDFLLVWNWENSLSDSEDPEDYESWIRTNHWEPEQTTAGPKGYLARARRFWNVVLVLEDIVPGWANSTEYEEMEQRGREVIINCEMALGAEHPPDPERRSDYSPPSCTTRDSCDTVVDLLCTGIRMTSSGNYEVSRVRLLSWAAEGNHKAVVELLLRTGKIDLNIRTISAFQQWPLYIAVYEGHKTIVELLLKLGDLNMYTKTLAAGVLLSLSAERGHEDVLSTLLEAWPEIFNSKNYLGLDPLWVAASKGFGDTVQQLLETTKFQVDAKGIHGQTPLSKASAAGHAAVVKLLLSTGEVNPDSKDNNERTPLWLAASEGHAAVVKLLLETDKVEVNSTNQYKETPLSRAVLGGHEAIVRLLLETRKVDFRAKDGFSLQTPLSLAAERGYETIVQLMLEKGNFDISMEDGFSSQSPLSRAAKGGHEAVVKLLLEAEIVAIKGRNLPLPPSHPLH